MEMRVGLYLLLEPSTGWWIAVLLLAKMADNGINYGWCSTQTHFYLVLTESENGLLLSWSQNQVVSAMLIKGATSVELLMPFA